MPHRDQAVPLVFYTEENERRVVGEAKMAINGALTIIEAVITDAEFARRISPGLDEISIGRMEEEPRVVDDRQAPKISYDLPPHKHEPTQHRDGRPPWCNVCKLTADFNTPVSTIPGRI